MSKPADLKEYKVSLILKLCQLLFECLPDQLMSLMKHYIFQVEVKQLYLMEQLEVHYHQEIHIIFIEQEEMLLQSLIV
jgi:flavin reductase (DIM6/NTAB) family NADH-FMN oxidoreductase RutF